jgi:CRP/FNR family cyclic AMP-dependent transcriptional regulator
MPLFDDLCQEQIEQLQRHLNSRILPMGTQLLTVDRLAHFIYIVVAGSLKLKSLRLDGTEITIALLGPGEVLGDAMTEEYPDDGFLVETIEPTLLLWMSQDAFRACLRSIPPLSYNFSQILSNRLRSTTRYLQIATRLDVNGRVAYRLLNYAQMYGRRDDELDGVLIPMRITQSDLAELIGASRVSVNQTLATFKKLGYLTMTKERFIVICNRDALSRLCYD